MQANADRSTVAVAAPDAGRQIVERPLAPGAWQAVRRCGAAHGLSEFSIALAALVVVLARLFDKGVKIGGTRVPLRATGSAPSFVALAHSIQTRPTQTAAAPGELLDCWFAVDPTDAALSTSSMAAAGADIAVGIQPPSDTGPGAIRLEIAPDLACSARARSLADAYVLLLETIDAHALGPPATLPLAWRHDRATNWTAAADCPPCALDDHPTDMAGLFAGIARRWPDAMGIVWPGGGMRFGEISAAADRMVALLSARGIRPGEVVGLRMKADAPVVMGPLFLVTWIAAARLGCAVLPIGQQVPTPQAAALLGAIDPRFVICAAAGLDGAQTWRAGAAAADLGMFLPGFAGTLLLERATQAAATPAPRDPDTAILFTTSGTTGAPKTIRVSEAMMLGLLRGLATSLVLPPGPALLGAAIGFDVIVSDLWLAWSFGHRVVMLPAERRTPQSFIAARALGARSTSLSPTQANAMLADDPACFEGYETLFLVGEVLSPVVLQRVRAAAPKAVVVNGYGPTETGVLATLWRAPDAQAATVPIGQALPGYRVLIADAELRPLPAQWPGELVIASAGPSRGYRDAALTQERFVELPGEAPGPFFRTGDYGWVDGAGQIRFIGRRDRQVKMMGIRVELDGVEHIIASLHGVTDAAVVMADLGHGRQIVALVQPNGGEIDPGVLQASVQAQCRAWLPRQAVPSRVIPVDTIPTDRSGKKSYARLVEMAQGSTPHAVARVEADADGAIDALAARLLAMWRAAFTAMGRPNDALRLDDDVFALGAGSIDVMRMAERIEQEFACRVPDDLMFVHPTIRAQAGMVAGAIARAAQPGAPGTTPRASLHLASLHLVRPARSAVSRGVILGLPEVNGRSGYLGQIAAHALEDYDIWGCTFACGDAWMTQSGAWTACARSIADCLRAGDAPDPIAFLGFSFGGFMGWLVDRILVGAGQNPRPVVNIDGSGMHLGNPDWQSGIADLLPPETAARRDAAPGRMLVIHQAPLARRTRERPVDADWAQAGLDFSVFLNRSVSHIDLIQPASIRAYAGSIAAFLDGTPAPCGRVEIAGLGGALFRILEDPARPTEAVVAQALAALPKGAVDFELREALLFAVLAAGDAGQALRLARRLTREDAGFRAGVYAEIAVLRWLGRIRAAADVAAAWCLVHPEDTAMRIRAVAHMQARVPWERIVNLHVGSDRAIDLAASWCAPDMAVRSAS